MKQAISKRLTEIIDALPLSEGMRILEVGCGSGTAAREIARRFKKVYVMGVDRSIKAIEQANTLSQVEIKAGRLEFVHSAIEDFHPSKVLKPFDLAFAIRVGALDGRHPEIERTSILCIKQLLKKTGKLFIDGGSPIQEIDLSRF